MKSHSRKTPQFAICIENTDNPVSLTLGRVYEVLPDKDAEETGCVRVIDNEGEDYMYPAANFLLADFPQKEKRILLRAIRSDAPSE